MKWTKENMFEPSGCFTREAFEALVNDTLPANAKVYAREHLNSCPFCSDALEGFQSQKKPFAEFMASSDETYTKAIRNKQMAIKRKRIVWISVSAAASILLLVGLFILTSVPEPKLQMAQNIVKDTTVSKQEEKTEPKEKIIEKEKQPTVPEAKVSQHKRKNNTIRFTTPEVSDEEIVSRDAIVEDKVKEESKPVAAASEAPKNIERYYSSSDMKVESAKGQRASVSQDTTVEENELSSLKSRKVSYSKKEQEVLFVELMPQYPGGKDAMNEFLKENLVYPTEAKEKNISGKVIVQFVVENNGKITNVKVLHGIGGGCDEEAIRVVSSMPNWKPGKQNGKSVPVFYTLPLTFSLPK